MATRLPTAAPMMAPVDRAAPEDDDDGEAAEDDEPDGSADDASGSAVVAATPSGVPQVDPGVCDGDAGSMHDVSLVSSVRRK